MSNASAIERRGIAGIPRGEAARPQAAIEAAADRRAAGTIAFQGVGKVYQAGAGAVHALQDVDAEIPAGSIFGIIGRSGAGKSSLLRTINRLEQPSRGRVLVDGADIAGLDAAGLVRLRRRIGMIFQHFNLLSAKTVRENVALPLKVAGVPRAEIERRVGELLGLVGLAGKEDSYPGRLSGGQKQRVGIARALVHRPEILLCDEATSALDPETTQSILALLRDINRRFGLTIVLITHEMRVIRDICDRVLVLEGGRVAEQGAVWQVFGTPRHAATRALLRPLESALPEDLALLLRAEPPASGRYEQLVELRYAGGASESDLPAAAPDLARIASALGSRARLLHAGLDRIQARTQGRLLVAVPSGIALPPVFAAPSPTHAKVLGYVPAYD